MWFPAGETVYVSEPHELHKRQFTLAKTQHTKVKKTSVLSKRPEQKKSPVILCPFPTKSMTGTVWTIVPICFKTEPVQKPNLL